MSAIETIPDDLKDIAQKPWPKGASMYQTAKGNTYLPSEYMAAREKLGLEPKFITDEEEADYQNIEPAWADSVPDGVISTPRTAEAFLQEAAELMAERGKQYDQKGGERSIGKTVKAFNAITGKYLTESEGWLLMSLLKRVRQHSGAGYHKDSAEDAVAYAALEAESLEAQK